jgi:flavin reductase (DIM6/NTAB) family NADH-FMN oxidoreductase RutF
MSSHQLLHPYSSSSGAKPEIVIANRLDAATFRTACSRFVTGITVVTLMGMDGLPYGVTVSSFASVSLDPPLILVCVDYRCHVLKHFALGNKFGVNVLSEQQRELSQQFARHSADRFSSIDWFRGKHGVPLLTGTIAAFECTLAQATPAGDHQILIGQVEEASHSEGNGLAYFKSSYRTLTTGS